MYLDLKLLALYLSWSKNKKQKHVQCNTDGVYFVSVKKNLVVLKPGRDI